MNVTMKKIAASFNHDRPMEPNFWYLILWDMEKQFLNVLLFVACTVTENSGYKNTYALDILIDQNYVIIDIVHILWVKRGAWMEYNPTSSVRYLNIFSSPSFFTIDRTIVID